jgi:PAS domain S-box-containing protein
MPISAFLNFTTDLIIVLDKYSRVLNANDAFFEFTNTRREDVVHKNIDHFAFPIKFDPSIEPYISEAIHGSGTTMESYYSKDNKGYYFNVKLIPLVFDDGEKGVTIIFEDITEKKLAEKALIDSNEELERKVRERTMDLEKANESLSMSEAYLLKAQQIAHLGYWSFNLKTREIRASDEACRVFGAEPGPTWTYDFFKLRVHPDDISKVETSDRDAIAMGKPINFEYRILLADGSMRVIHTIGEVRRDASGDAIEIFGTLQDVTERKRAEEKLAESERFLKNVFGCIQEGICVLDKDLNIIRVNPTMEKWYGAQISGSKCYEAYHGRSVPCEICPSIRAIRDKTIQKETLHDLGGWREIYAFPLIDDQGEVTGVIEHIRDINERKQVEEALRESEARFKTLFEGGSTAIFIIDVGTRVITDCNMYAAMLVGRPKDELIGMHHSKLHPPESADPCRRNTSIHSKDGSVKNYETEILHKDGHRIPILINSTIVELGGKKVMIGSYLDITERKLAEKALHDSEEKFRALADSSSIGILLIQGMDIIYVNQAIADLLGYTIDECRNMKYWDMVQPDMKEQIRQRAILRQHGEPGPSRKEFNIVKKNGEIIWLDCTAAVLQYRGNPAMMITAMDITARKMMERELRKSEEKYRSLVENVHDMVWETDENNACIYSSPRSREIMGYEPEELLGKTSFDLMVPEEVPRIMGLVKPLLEAHKPFELLGYWVVKKDGSKALIEANGMPMFDENGRFIGYRGMNRDITNGRQ